MSSGFRGNACKRPNFQRTRASHAAEFAGWLAMATDPIVASVSIDTLERRHGGKGGLKRAEIESKLMAERQRRAARA